MRTINIFIVLFFPCFLFAQNWKLDLHSSLDYISTYRTSESVLTVGWSDYVPYRPRIGTHIGVSINRIIFKRFSMETEIGYSLSGYNFVSTPPSSFGTPINNNGKIVNIHQIYGSLSAKYTDKKFYLNLGLINNQNLGNLNSTFNKNNWAYTFGFGYHFNKLGMGVKYTNYATSYLSILNLFKYYWQEYSLSLSYPIKSF